MRRIDVVKPQHDGGQVLIRPNGRVVRLDADWIDEIFLPYTLPRLVRGAARPDRRRGNRRLDPHLRGKLIDQRL